MIVRNLKILNLGACLGSPGPGEPSEEPEIFARRLHSKLAVVSSRLPLAVGRPGNICKKSDSKTNGESKSGKKNQQALVPD